MNFTIYSSLKLNLNESNYLSKNNGLTITDETTFTFSPSLFECFLIIVAFFIFVIGIFGNLLVVLVVFKNAHMKTITNIFIVNLAIGDFLVILICLPPSILNDVTGTWWFGKPMCKIIPYVQNISVGLSVMTLTSISYERYYAIVYPLKFLATKFRAKIIILIVWVLSFLISLPQPIVITMKEENGTNYCYPTWPVKYQITFEILIFVILYILPMALIFYTYTRVIKVLWKIDKSIAWDQPDSSAQLKKRSIISIQNSPLKYPRNSNSSNLTNSSLTNNQIMASGSSAAKSKMKNQIIARRKAAKMLISVAVMFALCYLPVHLLNIIRFVSLKVKILESLLESYGTVSFQIAHCLVYLNSCLNPLIYNFMSDNFRKEFKNILFCKMLLKKNQPNVEYLTSELQSKHAVSINRKKVNTERKQSNDPTVSPLIKIKN